MTEDEKASLTAVLNARYERYNVGAHAWSTLHHGALYLAAIGSAVAAVLLKVDSLNNWAPRLDVAASIGIVAAALTTMAASGGFERKWRANRIARGRIQGLQIDLTDPLADGETIRKGLKSVMEAEDEDVLGAKK